MVRRTDDVERAWLAGAHLSSRDDDVLAAVLDRDGPVRVPDGEVARVEPAARERARGRVRVGEVAVHDDVAAHDDLAERLAVPRDVDERVGRRARRELGREAHDARGVGGYEGVALPGRELGALVEREGRPERLRVVAGEGPVRLNIT